MWVNLKDIVVRCLILLCQMHVAFSVEKVPVS